MTRVRYAAYLFLFEEISPVSCVATRLGSGFESRELVSVGRHKGLGEVCLMHII